MTATSAETTTASQAARPPVRRRRRGLWAALLAGAVVVAMAVDTEYRSGDAAVASGPVAFDPVTFGEERYESEVVPAIQDAAVPLPELLTAIVEDPEAAGEEYGTREGTGNFTFSVSGEGTAGPVAGGLLPVTVEGVPAGTRVSLQVGPAINGTALRDASGTIRFGDFINQVAYADAATALNNRMKEELLADLDAASLAGETVRFVGAFTLLTPQTITITPVELEVAG